MNYKVYNRVFEDLGSACSYAEELVNNSVFSSVDIYYVQSANELNNFILLTISKKKK